MIIGGNRIRPGNADMPARSRGATRPSCTWPLARSEMRGRREDRVRAAPAIPCAMAQRSAHTSIQVQRRASGLPCAMVLRLMARSSRRRIPFASIAAGLTAVRTRLDSIGLRQLDTSHGCQNHTLLPYAITPLVLRGSIAHSLKHEARDRPAMPRARERLASTAPRTPRIVTTRTPLFDEAGWREDGADLGEMRSEIFLPRNLDDPNRVEMAGEIRA